MSSNASAANHWVNTAEAQNIEHFEQVRQIVQHNRFCTLATCSVGCIPWASPLYYHYNQQLTIYWASATTAQHSEYLAENQGLSMMTIYDSNALPGEIAGLYLLGQARIVSPEKTEEALECLFSRAIAHAPIGQPPTIWVIPPVAATSFSPPKSGSMAHPNRSAISSSTPKFSLISLVCSNT